MHGRINGGGAIEVMVQASSGARIDWSDPVCINDAPTGLFDLDFYP